MTESYRKTKIILCFSFLFYTLSLKSIFAFTPIQTLVGQDFPNKIATSTYTGTSYSLNPRKKNFAPFFSLAPENVGVDVGSSNGVAEIDMNLMKSQLDEIKGIVAEAEERANAAEGKVAILKKEAFMAKEESEKFNETFKTMYEDEVKETTEKIEMLQSSKDQIASELEKSKQTILDLQREKQELKDSFSLQRSETQHNLLAVQEEAKSKETELLSQIAELELSLERTRQELSKALSDDNDNDNDHMEKVSTQNQEEEQEIVVKNEKENESANANADQSALVVRLREQMSDLERDFQLERIRLTNQLQKTEIDWTRKIYVEKEKAHSEKAKIYAEKTNEIKETVAQLKVYEEERASLRKLTRQGFTLVRSRLSAFCMRRRKDKK